MGHVMDYKEVQKELRKVSRRVFIFDKVKVGDRVRDFSGNEYYVAGGWILAQNKANGAGG